MYDTHLKSFVAAADCGSFAKAAERVFISPNALIKHVNLLEHRLGVKLFVRSARGLKLTEAGKSIYRDARRVIAFSDEALAAAKRLEDAKEETVVLAHSPMTPARHIVRLWSRAAQKHPGIRLKIKNVDDRRHENIVAAGDGSEVDVIAGLVPTSILEWSLSITDLGEIPVCIAAPAEHPLAARGTARPEDLFKERLYMVKKGDSLYIDALRDWLTQNYPQIKIEDAPPYDSGVFALCSETGALMVSSPLWENVHPAVFNVRCDFGRPFTTRYGLITDKRPGEAVKTFVREVASLYRKGPVYSAS